MPTTTRGFSRDSADSSVGERRVARGVDVSVATSASGSVVRPPDRRRRGAPRRPRRGPGRRARGGAPALAFLAGRSATGDSNGAGGATDAYEFTSQLFFDDERTDQVYTEQPYAGRGERDTRNSNDNVFAQGDAERLALDLTETERGYAGAGADASSGPGPQDGNAPPNGTMSRDGSAPPDGREPDATPATEANTDTDGPEWSSEPPRSLAHERSVQALATKFFVSRRCGPKGCHELPRGGGF